MWYTNIAVYVLSCLGFAYVQQAQAMPSFFPPYRAPKPGDGKYLPPKHLNFPLRHTISWDNAQC